jgi:hypothetical protein
MQKTEFRTRDRWLIYAFLVGPLSALSHLTVAYALVPTACAQRSNAILHASTATFLLIALSGVLIGWRVRGRFRESDSVLWKERTHWLATTALVLSIASIVVIIALELPNVILRSCQ